MNILKFLLSNRDVVVAGAVLILFIVKRQYAVLDKIILVLVTEAKKKYGGGTGAAKLAAVIEGLYPKLPTLIRLFVSSAQLERLIERVLAEAQKSWSTNPILAAYSVGKPPAALN